MEDYENRGRTGLKKSITAYNLSTRAESSPSPIKNLPRKKFLADSSPQRERFSSTDEGAPKMSHTSDEEDIRGKILASNPYAVAIPVEKIRPLPRKPTLPPRPTLTVNSVSPFKKVAMENQQAFYENINFNGDIVDKSSPRDMAKEYVRSHSPQPPRPPKRTTPIEPVLSLRNTQEVIDSMTRSLSDFSLIADEILGENSSESGSSGIDSRRGSADSNAVYSPPNIKNPFERVRLDVHMSSGSGSSDTESPRSGLVTSLSPTRGSPNTARKKQMMRRYASEAIFGERRGIVQSHSADLEIYRDQTSPAKKEDPLRYKKEIVLPHGVKKSGWLSKKGKSKMKVWKKRFFYLINNELVYYEQPPTMSRSGKLKGKIVLNSKCVITKCIKQEKSQYVILLDTPKKLYKLKTNGEGDMEEWFTILFNAIESAPRSYSVANFNLKKSTTKPVFGTKLKEVMEYQESIGIHLPVPQVVQWAVECLSVEATLKTEGLMRISGSLSDLVSAKTRIDKGEDPALLGIVDPHTISGILKLYIRELPESIFSKELGGMFLKVQQNHKNDDYISSLKYLIHSLPRPNKELLKMLFEFFHLVTTYSEFNKMSSSNVSIIIGPNLLANSPAPGSPANTVAMMEESQLMTGLTLTLIDHHGEFFA